MDKMQENQDLPVSDKSETSENGEGILARADDKAEPEEAQDYDGMIADMETRLPENMKEAWNRIIAAGMKFLFDRSTNPEVNQYLEGEGDVPTKLGEGAAGLFAFLDKQSNGAMPKELIIPAGIVLLIEVVKYIEKAQIFEVTAKDFGNAINIYLEKVLGVYGGNTDMMQQGLEKATKDMKRPDQPQQQGGA